VPIGPPPPASPRWPVLAPGATEAPASGPTPSFSVVIATYQAASWLPDAVESALDQTLPPHEVIVVDDGSTDEPESALGGRAGEVVMIRRSHGGEGAAKDTGSRAASGDFVAFLDADDVYEPERLEALARLAAERPDLDILVTDAYLEREGAVVGRCYHEAMSFATVDQRRAILESNFLLGHLAIRRSRLMSVGGIAPDMEAVADWDAWIRAILDGARAGLVDLPLSRYRLRDDSVSGDRARLTRWKAVALRRALARDDLSPDERRGVADRVACLEREARLAEAEGLLAARRPARRCLARIAADRGAPAAVRIRAAAAAAAPGAARTLLVARGRSGRSRITRVQGAGGGGRGRVRAGTWACDRLGRLVGAGVAWGLRRTDRRVGLALMYHRVGDPPGRRDRDIVPALGSRDFRDHLDLVCRHYRPVAASALQEAVASRVRGEPIPVAITFDDDLRSHLTVAAPALTARGVPATFFLTGASLRSPRAFWWELLQHVLDARLMTPAEVVSATADWPDPLRPDGDGVRELARAVERLSPSCRERLQAMLRTALTGRRLPAGLDASEVLALSSAGFEIGFHTLSHARLSDLVEQDLERELRAGVSELACLVGAAGMPLAYPHGAVDGRVAAAAREAGFRTGLTTTPAAVAPGDDPLLLGRLDAAGMSAGTLAVRMARVLVRGEVRA
jgi:peptidoglycan/xylan/chitin deacetylase (PgdA/CDA1 family)